MTSRARNLGMWAAIPAALMLAACGGGGGGGDTTPAPTPTPPSTQATVSSATVTNAKYSQNALVTINGSNLDAAAINVTSASCTGMARSTAAPNVSTATTAYYTCKAGTVADNQSVSIVRTADSTTLATPTFNVPLPQVTMTVNNGAGVSGNMVITLEAVKTPITVNNFLAYTNAGFYDGTVFHRSDPGFVIQGGGYLPVTGTPTLKTGLLAPIELEVNKGLSNVQWSIAMARNSDPNSATSQFFINLVNNTQLDPGVIPPGLIQVGYAVFGGVTANTALVTAIETAPCSAVANFFNFVPTPAMVITKAEQTR
jgi:cyclophilin family peptidyl-prolyl cis-trans isomerase